ncbi:2-phosphosulfolactate phosphatase [Aurantimicrobium minutum]|nr:2-phosphosulfolactate phosphatase [Aurantimicrobium minutum]
MKSRKQSVFPQNGVMEQTRYQVRFDWAAEGAHAIGSDADVIVWVDAITEPGADLDLSLLPSAPAVIRVDLPSAQAAAQWIIDLQVKLAKRILIAVVAAGSTRDGQLRVTTEDLLAAGAVIDHLAALGLDATSPEAAAAEAAYRGLARATSHLMTAVSTAATTAPENYQLKVDATLTPADVQVVRG